MAIICLYGGREHRDGTDCELLISPSPVIGQINAHYTEMALFPSEQKRGVCEAAPDADGAEALCFYSTLCLQEQFQ